nr:phage minor tail protein L [uncultured Mediterranean phage uvMED]
MTRSLTSATKTELATNDIRPVHLITIGFGTPVNITDCSFPITSSVSGSSVTYIASDFIMGVSDFTEETDVNLSPISISLSGADQTFISTVLNENVINDAVTIFRGFLDDNNALIADPFLLYKGTIDNFSISESDTSSLVNLDIVSHWADFEKKSGRKTNNTSQQRFFSTDLGMNFSSQTVLDIKWGRA